MSLIKNIECDICGHSKVDYFFGEYGFDLLKCTNCGVVFVHPKPTSEFLKKLYNKEIVSKYSKSFRLYQHNESEGCVTKFKGYLSLIKQFKKKG